MNRHTETQDRIATGDQQTGVTSTGFKVLGSQSWVLKRPIIKLSGPHHAAAGQTDSVEQRRTKRFPSEFPAAQRSSRSSFYLVLQLLHDVRHHPVLVHLQPVSLSKVKVRVEVCRPATPKLLLPVQDDRLVLKHTQVAFCFIDSYFGENAAFVQYPQCLYEPVTTNHITYYYTGHIRCTKKFLLINI